MQQKLPFTVLVDDSDSPSDIIDALMLTPFTTGAQPFARAERLSKVFKDAPLRPQSGKLQRVSSEDGQRSHLVAGEGWTLRATRWQGDSAHVTVTAISEELAESILRETVDGAVDLTEDPPGRVSMGFWHTCGSGPVRRNRMIDTPSWTDIRDNYSAPVTQALESLMGLTGETLTGRLLLLHGAPGTGKTTALRALAQAWGKWCQIDCVLDPERLFQEPGYLLQVSMGNEDDDTKWRLLLLEDCDELVSATAKSTSGQGLSRLLNLTDGMLAQGRKILVGLTTNEPISSLHPAVVRPGRCLAQIEVGPLTPEEGSRWLGRPMERHATLAELFALKAGNAQVSHLAPPPATGCYL